MKVALDLDNTLVMYHEFYNKHYISWCKAHGVTQFLPEPRTEFYDLEKHWGMTLEDIKLFDEDLFPLYARKAPLLDGCVKFVQDVMNLGYDPCILTHRHPRLEELTRLQIAPILEVYPDMKMYFTLGKKSEVMLAERIDLILDDSRAVIEDVSSTPGLQIMSPVREYNKNLPTKYYNSFNAAALLMNPAL